MYEVQKLDDDEHNKVLRKSSDSPVWNAPYFDGLTRYVCTKLQEAFTSCKFRTLFCFRGRHLRIYEAQFNSSRSKGNAYTWQRPT